MYIETDRDNISRLRIREDGTTYTADFNDDGVARVTKEAGNVFAERYTSVEIREEEN
jgi:hypothetical protein